MLLLQWRSTFWGVCSHLLQAGMGNRRETIVKRVCQQPLTSFFPHCWLASSAKWGGGALCAPGILGVRKGKNKRGYLRPCGGRRHVSYLMRKCFPKELRLVGEVGEGREALVTGERRQSLCHTQFTGPALKRVNAIMLLVIPGNVSLLSHYVRFKWYHPWLARKRGGKLSTGHFHALAQLFKTAYFILPGGKTHTCWHHFPSKVMLSQTRKFLHSLPTKKSKFCVREGSELYSKTQWHWKTKMLFQENLSLTYTNVNLSLPRSGGTGLGCCFIIFLLF